MTAWAFEARHSPPLRNEINKTKLYTNTSTPSWHKHVVRRWAFCRPLSIKESKSLRYSFICPPTRSPMFSLRSDGNVLRQQPVRIRLPNISLIGRELSVFGLGLKFLEIHRIMESMKLFYRSSCKMNLKGRALSRLFL